MNVVAEPTPKRRTLVERGGESQSIAPTPSSSRMTNPSVKGTTLPGAYRNPSFSSSVSSRTPSASSRNTSNSSFASSLGPGASRPQSAMGNRGPLQAPATISRPASSLENHMAGPSTKRKGMDHISISPFEHTPYPFKSTPREQNRGYDNQFHCTPNWSSPRPALAHKESIHPLNRLRDVSLSIAMHELSLDPVTCPSSPFAQRGKGPHTPSQLPKPISLKKQSSAIFLPVSPPKRQRSPPKIIPFLTRDSNLKAWDTKGRLEDMETLYSQLTDQMDGTRNECNALKETVPLYKTRSMYSITILISSTREEHATSCA